MIECSLNDRAPRDDPTGIACAVLAYGLWGIVPLYWRLLDAVPPFELTVHRIVWCALFVMALALSVSCSSASGCRG